MVTFVARARGRRLAIGSASLVAVIGLAVPAAIAVPSMAYAAESTTVGVGTGRVPAPTSFLNAPLTALSNVKGAGTVAAAAPIAAPRVPRQRYLGLVKMGVAMVLLAIVWSAWAAVGGWARNHPRLDTRAVRLDSGH